MVQFSKMHELHEKEKYFFDAETLERLRAFVKGHENPGEKTGVEFFGNLSEGEFLSLRSK